MNFDVVVIGAGPAGLCTALALGARGISTLVCESSRLPVDKACGEGIMPSAVDDLERLGVSAGLLWANGRRFDGVRYVSPAGRVAQASFDEGPGVGLRRVALSELLLVCAQQLPSVRVVQGARAHLRREPGRDGHRRRLALQVEGALLEPRLIVGADGLNSHLRRQAHITSQTHPPLRWGVRQHFEVAPWTDHVEVHWAASAEAYVTPVSDDRVNVAFLFERDDAIEQSKHELVNHLLGRFPALAERLAGAHPFGKARASGPLHQWPERPYVEGLVLVGDAAGYVDALSGEGVGIAARQALLLAEVIGPLLEQGGERPIPARALARFVRAQRRAARSGHVLTRLLLWLKRHPALLERSISALARDENLFRHFLSANQGGVPLSQVPRGSGLRLLGALLTGAGDATPSFESSHHALRHPS